MSSAYTTDYLTAPSETVNLAAVAVSGKEIRFITDPSWAVQLAAVAQDASAIAEINNPSEDLQLIVVADGWMLRHIKQPTPAVVAKAILNAPAILFSTEDKLHDRVTAEALNLIKPGLATALEGIRTLNLTEAESLVLFNAAREEVPEEAELPADVDQY